LSKRHPAPFPSTSATIAINRYETSSMSLDRYRAPSTLLNRPQCPSIALHPRQSPSLVLNSPQSPSILLNGRRPYLSPPRHDVETRSRPTPTKSANQNPHICPSAP
jgi:hypothetical protein